MLFILTIVQAIQKASIFLYRLLLDAVMSHEKRGRFSFHLTLTHHHRLRIFIFKTCAILKKLFQRAQGFLFLNP